VSYSGTTRPRFEHTIKANDQERIPHQFVAFDTETRPERDGKTLTHRWRLGCAVGWRNDTKRSNAPEWIDAESPAQLWEWITARANTAGRLWVFAHNLGFDAAVSDAFNILPGLGWELTRLHMGDSLTRADWSNGNRRMILIDTLSYFPKALQSIAETMGMDKPSLPESDAESDAWAHRCREDVRILKAAMDTLIGWWRENGCGNFQPTGSGLAWSMWRHKFMPHKVKCHADPETLAAERESIYMGRCEALIKGKRLKGPWVQWDMHAAYCRIAARSLLPVRLAESTRQILPSRRAHVHENRRVLYDVTVATEVPVLPWQDKVGICWPVGEFRTLIWDCEYDLAVEVGAKLTVHHVWLYDAAPALAEWGEWTLSAMEAGDDQFPGPVPIWVKHQSRALIGKFATTVPTWVEWGATPDLVPDTQEAINADTGHRGHLFTLGGAVYSTEGRELGHDAFPALTSWVTAQGRVRLWRALAACPEGSVAYCDTDGLWVSKAGSEAMVAHAEANPGHGWRVKDESRHLTIYGPRQIVTDSDHAVAGVPKRAIPAGPGKWRGEQWEGFVSAMQRDGGGSVRVVERAWQARGVDNRRGPNGEPVRVADGLRAAF